MQYSAMYKDAHICTSIDRVAEADQTLQETSSPRDASLDDQLFGTRTTLHLLSRSSFWKSPKTLAAAITSLVSILAFILMYLYLASQPFPIEAATPIDHTQERGRTSRQAIAHGCTFDQLSMLWMPPEVSRIGTAEFLNLGGPTGWQYWADMAGQHPISNISMHTTVHWTTQREHLAHCAFHFLRVSDALRGRGTYDVKVFNQEHNKHCAMMLLNASMQAPAGEIDSRSTSSFVGFGSGVVE
jgi:hypothetical protein